MISLLYEMIIFFLYLLIYCSFYAALKKEMNFSTEELRTVAEHCNERSLYKEQDLCSQVTKHFMEELKKRKSCFF